jgi:hypothetical protein
VSGAESGARIAWFEGGAGTPARAGRLASVLSVGTLRGDLMSRCIVIPCISPSLRTNNV